MPVSLPTTMATEFLQGEDKLIAGVSIEVFLLFGVKKPAQSSDLPGHGMGLTSSEDSFKPTSALLGLALAGGEDAVAQETDLILASIGTADDTVTVGGETFTAKAVPAGANEFAVGATATESMQLLKAKINALTNTTLCLASGAGATLRLTANTPGTAFATSKSGGFAELTITQITANDAGAKASIEISLAGDLYARIINSIGFFYTEDSSTRAVMLQHVIQADSPDTVDRDSEEAAECLEELRTTLVNAITGVASDDEHRYFTSNVEDEDTDIRRFMETWFGTSSSFTITVGNRLKIEAGAVGANGNNIKIFTEVLQSAPGPLPRFNAKNVPQFRTGVVIHSGIQDEGKISNTTEILKVKGSNGFGTLLSIQGDSDSAVSMKLQINNDPTFLARIIAAGGLTFDSKNNIFTSNNNTTKTKIAVLVVYKSKTTGAAKNAKWYYDCKISGAVDREMSLRGIGGYTLNFEPQQDLERTGDPICVEWNPRSL